MRGRDYPAGVPCWVETAQPDPEAARAFYAGLFGWELDDRGPGGTPDRYYLARIGGSEVAAVASLPDPPARGAGWLSYVLVDSADDATGRVVAAGGKVVRAPYELRDAARVAVCADPEGAVFGVWQPRQLRGAQLANAPNTWNFSDLHTRDPAGAEAFYSAVFGWAATDAGFAMMWRVPGYGEFIDAYVEPGFRQRHAEAGTPEGFTDAIGWLAPISEDQPVAPHWSVTFVVADPAATVELAVRLGGSVESPLVEIGYSRVATLRDPQGAVFTVHSYEPPS